MTKLICLGLLSFLILTATDIARANELFTAYDSIRISALLSIKQQPGAKAVPDERLCKGYSYLGSITRALDQLSGSHNEKVIANHQRMTDEYWQLVNFCAHRRDPITHRIPTGDDAVNSARNLYGLSIEGIKLSTVESEATAKHVVVDDAPTPECGVQWGGSTKVN